MKQCKCGSMAFNLRQEGIDQGDLCDRHYWQDRAEAAEKDAARYRFLKGRWLPLALSSDLTRHALCFGARPDEHDCADLDSAIDAAIAKDAP